MMKVVIFDFDGTLADSFPWFLSRINQVAELLHFNKVKEQDVVQLRMMNVQEILRFLNIKFYKIPLIMFYMRRLMAQETETISLFPDVPGLLKRLAEKEIHLVILSSNSESNVKKILKETAHHVGSYYCGAGLRAKTKHFKQLKSKYPNADLLSIGDELRDFEAAQDQGITHLSVSWGYADKSVFYGLEVMDTFSQLEDRIFRQFNIER